MSANDTIKDAIRILSKTDDAYYSYACKVLSVTGNLCDCEPINGDADLLEVRLIADDKTGILIVPKVGSTVLVTMINKMTGYVAMFSEVDSIALNGTNYDGLVRVSELTDKINALEDAFNNHILAYNLHTHPGVTSGASSTAITVPDAQILTPTQQAEIENLTVKHGNG